MNPPATWAPPALTSTRYSPRTRPARSLRWRYCHEASDQLAVPAHPAVGIVAAVERQHLTRQYRAGWCTRPVLRLGITGVAPAARAAPASHCRFEADLARSRRCLQLQPGSGAHYLGGTLEDLAGVHQNSPHHDRSARTRRFVVHRDVHARHGMGGAGRAPRTKPAYPSRTGLEGRSLLDT